MRRSSGFASASSGSGGAGGSVPSSAETSDPLLQPHVESDLVERLEDLLGGGLLEEFLARSLHGYLIRAAALLNRAHTKVLYIQYFRVQYCVLYCKLRVSDGTHINSGLYLLFDNSVCNSSS